MIHGKYLLLMVVILNIIDCLLVLGELMLDIKYVTDLLTKEYERSDKFVGSMKGLYPQELNAVSSIEHLEHELLLATITWNHYGNSKDAYTGNNNGNHSNFDNNHSNPMTTTLVPHDISTHVRRRRASTDEHNNDTGSYGNDTASHGSSYHGDHHAHSIEEEIAHGLHKASISILGILVLETFLKIFCFGTQMFEHKLECFDSFIVIASFIVDIVFIKGLQQFTVQEFVLILAFMVPWRIIRVVNSLVVAIMDHEHFRLVLLYKQKKKVSNELKEAKSEIKGLEACISALEQMCQDAGLPDSMISAKLNMYRKVKAKTNAMGALSSFAIGGDAMKKPFHMPTPSNGLGSKDVVINVDDTLTTNIDDDSKPITNGGLTDHRLNTLFDRTNHLKNEELLERPRSRSALEVRDAKSDLLRVLAENSATFIATMNKDQAELRDRVEKLMMKYKEQQKGENSNQLKTEDNTLSRDRIDNDEAAELVKDDKNNDNNDDDGGIDNPATHM
ncbi:Voltage-gated hydrogen channel 1 [Mactra antiquata]